MAMADKNFNTEIMRVISRCEIEMRVFLITITKELEKETKKKKEKQGLSSITKYIYIMPLLEILQKILSNEQLFSRKINLKTISTLLEYFSQYSHERLITIPFGEEKYIELLNVCTQVVELRKNHFIDFNYYLISLLNNTSINSYNETYLKIHNIVGIDNNQTEFIGRSDEIANIKEALSSESNIISINGIGGVGKTTLLQKVLRDVITENAYDYIIWTTSKFKDLTIDTIKEVEPSLRSIDDIYDNIISLVYFKTDISNFKDLQRHESKKFTLDSTLKKKIVSDFLTNFKFLVVIDNYETISDNEEILAFIREMNNLTNHIGQLSQSKIIMTSRKHLEVLNIKGVNIEVKGLESENAIKLFDTVLEVESKYIEYEDKIICTNLVDRNPLAIIWCINWYLHGDGGKSIVEIFEQSTNVKVDSLEIKNNILLEYTLGDILNELTKTELQILLTLSVMNKSVSLKIISFCSNITCETVLDAIKKLSQLNLVYDTIGPNNKEYSIHDLIKEYILQSHAENDELINKIAENRKELDRFKTKYNDILEEDFGYDSIDINEISKNTNTNLEDKIYVFEALKTYKSFKNKELSYSDTLNLLNKLYSENNNIEIAIATALVQSINVISHNGVGVNLDNIIKTAMDEDKNINISRGWRVYGELEKRRIKKKIISIDTDFHNSDSLLSAIDKFERAKELEDNNVKTIDSLAYCYTLSGNRDTENKIKYLNKSKLLVDDYFAQNQIFCDDNLEDIITRISGRPEKLFKTYSDICLQLANAFTIFQVEGLKYYEKSLEFINLAIACISRDKKDFRIDFDFEIRRRIILNKFSNYYISEYLQSSEPHLKSIYLEKSLQSLIYIAEYERIDFDYKAKKDIDNSEKKSSRVYKNSKRYYFTNLLCTYYYCVKIYYFAKDFENVDKYLQAYYSTLMLKEITINSTRFNANLSELNSLLGSRVTLQKNNGIIIDISQPHNSTDDKSIIKVSILDSDNLRKTYTCKYVVDNTSVDNTLEYLSKLKEKNIIINFTTAFNLRHHRNYAFNAIATDEIKELRYKKKHYLNSCGKFIFLIRNTGKNESKYGLIFGIIEDIFTKETFKLSYDSFTSKAKDELDPLKSGITTQSLGRFLQSSTLVKYKKNITGKHTYCVEIEFCNTNCCCQQCDCSLKRF